MIVRQLEPVLVLRRALLSAAMLVSATSLASASVEISAKPTVNMTCSGGVCTPTAKKAVLNVDDLAGMLASGNATVKSTSLAQDIEIDSKVSWRKNTRLTLDSYRSITVNQQVRVTGVGGLTITVNDGGSGGDYQFVGGGNVYFSNDHSSLIINGHTYRLVDTLKQLGRDIRRDGNGFYALAKSINAAGKIYTSSPISHAFGGVFEGLGNTIANMTIQSSSNQVGLFYELVGPTSDCVVRDIGLVSANVTGGQDSKVGALAAWLNQGVTIKNSYATGEVSGGAGSLVGGLAGSGIFSNIVNSHADVSVSGSSNAKSIGGLIGYNEGGCQACFGSIIQSYANGAVFGGDNASVGGLIGENSGATISDSYLTGTVTGGSASRVGGLIGLGSDSDLNGVSTVASSYSTGHVTGGSGASVGGLIGSDASDSQNSNVYWDMDASGINNPAQGAGNVPNDPGLTGLTTEQFKSGLPSGFDTFVWREKPKLNTGYPSLIGNPPPKH